MISPNKSFGEWLEADGLGGFASGTVNGIRTRRYHALLLTATTPPSGRMVLVNGFDAWIETESGSYPISSQRYTPDVIHPDGIQRLEDFQREPWPQWSFLLEDGRTIQQEIFVHHESSTVAIIWRLSGNGGAKLRVRPFLSGRDYHSLHHANPDFRFDSQIDNQRILWHPYNDLPEIAAFSNGIYSQEPLWYRNFFYSEEQARGLDFTEDLASPGTFLFDLLEASAVLIFSTDKEFCDDKDVELRTGELRNVELQRRKALNGRLNRSADSYIVKRVTGKTIIAGYPWFTDWGRDTFIALRGLTIATGKLDVADQILCEWAGNVSGGMLPNRFPDHGSTPEFNSVDASLWFIVAVHDFLNAADEHHFKIQDRKLLQQACEEILNGYIKGTRYRIHIDDDSLIAAGESGVQLTWMDAKVGDWVVTPRIGKPVEIQALWLNALRIAAEWSPEWMSLFEQGCENFHQRFWNAEGGYLFDVVDSDHISGKNDPSFRPNQIFAIGGLPFQIIKGEEAQRVVEAVESRLLTPLGLRTLAPESPGYVAHYEGGVLERDGAYHQGTVWPWLIGAFVEAWLRVRGNTHDAKMTAKMRFITPLIEHLDQAGLGHISEITDAETPYTPRGCPFQAWSLGEMIRIMMMISS